MMEKEIKDIVGKKINAFLLKDNKVIENIIDFLIEERERINVRIQEVMYEDIRDINKKLSEKQIQEIVRYRDIDVCIYHTICKFEELRKNNESK